MKKIHTLKQMDYTFTKSTIIQVRKELNTWSRKKLIDTILFLAIKAGLRFPAPRKIPKRKALPYNGRIDKRRKTKRKFSRKQLAAQRLFAKRARAGTLRKRRRR